MIRDNTLAVDKHYINKLPFYLRELGFDEMKIYLIAKDSDEDGVYTIKKRSEPSDYFELAFSDKNTYQILTFLNQIKLDILSQERVYLQSKL